MNRILDKIITARNGHYCHCLEVNEVYELESIADNIIQEFEENYYRNEIVDFLETLQIYALNEDNEEEIYNFSFTEYIKENYYWEQI